jgi:hypothetical protein
MTTGNIEGPAVLEISLRAGTLQNFVRQATAIGVQFFQVGAEKLVFGEIEAVAVVAGVSDELIYHECTCKVWVVS